MSAFGALVSSGRVRRLGVSNHPTWRVERGRALAQGLGIEPWTALQLTTSYVEPRPGAQVPGKDHRFGWVTEETRDYLAEHPELNLWVYSPLVQGSFDRADRPFPEAYDHPGTTERLAALRAEADDRDVPASQLVLAWMVAQGWHPIVGVSSLAAGHLTLLPALKKALEDLGRPDIMVVIGGVIPPDDVEPLKQMGAAAVFLPGTVIADSALDLLDKLRADGA